MTLQMVIENLKHYLSEGLGEHIEVRHWEAEGNLPLFLTDSYAFYETSLFGQMCVLMVARALEAPTPATIKKHWEQVQKHGHLLCIYVQASIIAYNRKRLIQQRIPFIIPGTQMYLPDLGIDLREHLRNPVNEVESFGPATQAVILFVLYNGTDKKYSPSELAKALGYSRMTLTRAFNQLQAAGVGEVHRQRKARVWSFKGSTRALWDQAKSLMRSPVKRRAWVRSGELGMEAGLSALAHDSMLSPPAIPVCAVSVEEWTQLGLDVLPTPDEATAEIEIWHYDPTLFAQENLVDHFSLYLTLAEVDDERIELALEQMMEEIEW